MNAWQIEELNRIKNYTNEQLVHEINCLIGCDGDFFDEREAFIADHLMEELTSRFLGK